MQNALNENKAAQFSTKLTPDFRVSPCRHRQHASDTMKVFSLFFKLHIK